MTEQKQRTTLQNKAIHAYFNAISNEFINKGITLNMLIKTIEIYPNADNIKDIFKSIAKTKYNKDSTTDLTTKELSDIVEIFKIAISKLGIDLEFGGDTERLLNFYK